MERISNKKNVLERISAVPSSWSTNETYTFVGCLWSTVARLLFLTSTETGTQEWRANTQRTPTHTHTKKIDTRRMKTLHLEPWTMKWPINEMNYVTNTARGPIVPRGRATILFRERKEVEDGPPPNVLDTSKGLTIAKGFDRVDGKVFVAPSAAKKLGRNTIVVCKTITGSEYRSYKDF